MHAFDDRRESMAETCRRVGLGAEQLGLTRPSYVHLRRIIVVERRRQDELREIVSDVTRRLLVGLRVDAYEVAERVRDTRR